MKLDGMVARFCYVWLGYWLVFFVQPVKSMYRETEFAWLLQFLFVILVVVSYMAVHDIKASRRLVSARAIRPFDSSLAYSVVIVGYLISFFGLAFLVIDKVVVQGIDYSAGIASAREQWRVLGVERDGGASSFYSAAGYLLGSSYFLSLAMIFSRRLVLQDWKRLGFMIIGFFLLLANSLITGGRSGILLAAVFISYAYFENKPFNNPNLFYHRKYRVGVWSLLLVTVFYALYVFGSRATVTDVDLATYSLEFLDFLGLDAYGWFVDFSNASRLGGLLALLNLAVSYLTHSFATMAAIVEFNGGRETVVFSHLMSLLDKLGLASSVPGDWFLAGRFASLPGAVYHQFGIVGMVLGGMLIGTVGGWISGLNNRRSNSILILFLCSIMESIMLMSPFIFVGDVLFFPFMVLGGLMSLIFAKIARGKIGI